ncbi:cell division protein FtsQ/DivIB [Smaragdicoccus niigatensis]
MSSSSTRSAGRTEYRESAKDSVAKPTRIEPPVEAPPRRGKWKSRLLIALILVLAGVLGWAVYFSPMFSVRRIDVEGLHVVKSADVMKALDVPMGVPLLQVDTKGAARRVANLPKVALVRVQRNYPSALKVTVTERVAAAYFTTEQGTHLVDLEGVDFSTEPAPKDLPRLRIDSPSQRDPRVVAAMTVLGALPKSLRSQVTELYAKTPASVQLMLADGKRVVWGSADSSELKANVLVALLSQQGRTYDVSSPDLPTIR